MTSFIETNVPLRIFGYLRIKHGYRMHYNIWIPGFLTGLFFVGAISIADELPSVGDKGLLGDFSQLLAILSPFYLAALAAVSTFGGKVNFDSPIEMKNPPEITHFVKGRWDTPKVLTTRQFLSLLFGYCAAVSIILFLVTVLSEKANAINVGAAWSARFYLDYGISLSFLFVFFHMITASFLGIYYLSDKIHRDN